MIKMHFMVTFIKRFIKAKYYFYITGMLGKWEQEENCMSAWLYNSTYLFPISVIMILSHLLSAAR
jgi:hypothetical protein